MGEGFLQPRSMGWNGQYPPSDTCYFYNDYGYTGSELVLSLNGADYREIDLTEGEYGNWNDEIWSWMCGDNVRVDLCYNWLYDSSGCRGAYG